MSKSKQRLEVTEVRLVAGQIRIKWRNGHCGLVYLSEVEAVPDRPLFDGRYVVTGRELLALLNMAPSEKLKKLSEASDEAHRELQKATNNFNACGVEYPPIRTSFVGQPPASDNGKQVIDFARALQSAEPDMSEAEIASEIARVFAASPNGPEINYRYPSPPEVTRLWSSGVDETVNSWGDRNWNIRDLRAAVAGQPVFDLPLSLIPLKEHQFNCPDIFEFARHMLHVQQADLSHPVIMDEYGWIMDGRHRIVKALLEGYTTIKCVRLPEGLRPSSFELK